MASGGLIARIGGVFALNNILEACDLAARTGNDRDGKVIITFRE